MTGSKAEIRPGVWKLRVYTGELGPKGSPRQVSRTVQVPTRQKDDGSSYAERELAKLVAEVSTGKVSAGTETVGQLLDMWLEHCEALGRSPTTMRKYRQIAEAVVRPELGKVRLSKLTARHLDALYAKLTAKGNKPTTVRRVHALMSAALHQARKWRLVAVNVTEDASPPAVHAEPIEVPAIEDVRAMLTEAEKLEPALGTLLAIGALTGARRGELCALRWSDIDWHAQVLTIARSVYEIRGGGWAEKPTKTHQVRRVGLDELGIAVLRKHRQNVDALAHQLGLAPSRDAFMFSRSPVGSEPIRPDVVSKFAIRVAKKAGLNTHLHALRHFSATQLIAGGHDVRTVAGRLGHADASITLRVYSHVLPVRDREAAAALGKALLPTMKTRSAGKTGRQKPKALRRGSATS